MTFSEWKQTIGEDYGHVINFGSFLRAHPTATQDLWDAATLAERIRCLNILKEVGLDKGLGVLEQLIEEGKA
jgi:hypothetical protein